jgi:hypothetical protein
MHGWRTCYKKRRLLNRTNMLMTICIYSRKNLGKLNKASTESTGETCKKMKKAKKMIIFSI